jgi:hypothetical protein
MGQTEEEGGPPFLAIIQAGKVIVDCVSLYMGIIGIGDAAEYSRFSLGDPGLETGGGKVLNGGEWS